MLDHQMTATALDLAVAWCRSAREALTLEEQEYCCRQADYYWYAFVNAEFKDVPRETPGLIEE